MKPYKSWGLLEDKKLTHFILTDTSRLEVSRHDTFDVVTRTKHGEVCKIDWTDDIEGWVDTELFFDNDDLWSFE